jgi:hypothetical protein
MNIEDLPADALVAGQDAAGKYEMPADTLPPGATAVTGGLAATAWRKGFAAGWAMRHTRDAEPEVGAMVWFRRARCEYLAVRDSIGWRVTGAPDYMSWTGLLENAEEWGRLSK